MWTVAEFRIRFPEFDLATDEYLKFQLDDAALELDETVWGKLYSLGVGYLAAHKMTLSPFGMNAKLMGTIDSVARDNTVTYSSTTYGRNYQRLLRAVGVGFVVI